MSRKRARISDILDRIPDHPYLVLKSDDPLDGLAEKVQRFSLLRNIYVVDDDDRLIGYISLGRLIRYLTAMRRRSPLHYHALLEYVSFNCVSDIMEQDVIYAFVDDLIEPMLERMVERGIKEMPVVDKEKRIVSNVGILDLWRFTNT